MKTRAKFYVSGVTLLPGQSGVKATLSAVARGDRNASWAAASPEGSMTLTINNPAAAKQWEDFMQESRRTGKQPEVFIDIFAATDGWAGDGHLFRPGEGSDGTIYAPRYCGECGLEQGSTMRDAAGEEPRLVHPNG